MAVHGSAAHVTLEGARSRALLSLAQSKVSATPSASVSAHVRAGGGAGGGGGEPAHTPAVQTSLIVATSPSSQSVPSFAFTSSEHWPVSAEHVPCTLHTLLAGSHVTPAHGSTAPVRVNSVRLTVPYLLAQRPRIVTAPVVGSTRFTLLTVLVRVFEQPRVPLLNEPPPTTSRRP